MSQKMSGPEIATRRSLWIKGNKDWTAKVNSRSIVGHSRHRFRQRAVPGDVYVWETDSSPGS